MGLLFIFPSAVDGTQSLEVLGRHYYAAIFLVLFFSIFFETGCHCVLRLVLISPCKNGLEFTVVQAVLELCLLLLPVSPQPAGSRFKIPQRKAPRDGLVLTRSGTVGFIL